MKKTLLIIYVVMASVSQVQGGYLSRIFQGLCFVNKHADTDAQQKSSEELKEAFRKRWRLKYECFMSLHMDHTHGIESCATIFFQSAITSSMEPIIRNMNKEHEVSESINGMLKETVIFHDKGSQTPLQVAMQKEEESCSLFPGELRCLAARRITDIFCQIMKSNNCDIDTLPEMQRLLAQRR